MRISSDFDSPYYSPAVAYCTVLLDGVKQYKCIEADSSEGWCSVWTDDPDGTESKATLYGNVEILVATEASSLLRIPNFSRTAAWLSACGKEPKNPKDLAVQLGVHLEEMAEFLEQLDLLLPVEVGDAIYRLHSAGQLLKGGQYEAKFHDPVKALDALCDMEVTGNGLAFLAGWDKMKADHKVLKANDEKLVDGKPVILEGGKIGKPEGWVAADLSDCV